LKKESSTAAKGDPLRLQKIQLLQQEEKNKLRSAGEASSLRTRDTLVFGNLSVIAQTCRSYSTGVIDFRRENVVWKLSQLTNIKTFGRQNPSEIDCNKAKFTIVFGHALLIWKRTWSDNPHNISSINTHSSLLASLSLRNANT
jgi:hypothetical protein